MIIDIHTHIFPDRIAASVISRLSKEGHIKAYSDGTAHSLRTAMDAAGVDVSILLPVATSSEQVTGINDFALRQNEHSDQTGLISFGCIHPDFGGYREELMRLKENGIKGIKLHPVYQGANLDDLRFLRIMDCAAGIGLAVVTHMGLDAGFPEARCCTPAMACHVLDEIGSFPLVLAHMGGCGEWDQAVELLTDRDVMLDTAFSTGRFYPDEEGHWAEEEMKLMDPPAFMKMLRHFGADRILFGTDHPWSDIKTPLDFIRELPLSEEEKEKILGGNAARLLGL